eukprot:scaffold307125_cov33-Prasinocladus_malaysianus.AAC.1
MVGKGVLSSHVVTTHEVAAALHRMLQRGNAFLDLTHVWEPVVLKLLHWVSNTRAPELRLGEKGVGTCRVDSWISVAVHRQPAPSSRPPAVSGEIAAEPGGGSVRFHGRHIHSTSGRLGAGARCGGCGTTPYIPLHSLGASRHHTPLGLELWELQQGSEPVSSGSA